MSSPFKMKGHSLPGPNQASPLKQIWATMMPKSSKNKYSGKKSVKSTTNPKKGLSQYDPKRGDDPYTTTSKDFTYGRPITSKSGGYVGKKIVGISKEQFMKSKK